MRIEHVVSAALVAALCCSGLRAQEPFEAQRARAAAALGLPAGAIAIETAGRRTAGPEAQVFEALKVRLLDSSDVVAVYLDSAGRRVDVDALDAQTASTVSAFDRKVSGLLRERLERDAGTQKVGIWCATDLASVDQRAAATRLAEAGMPAADVRRDLRERVARANVAAVDQAKAALAALGLPVLYADAYAPVVFTNANAAQVAMLAELPIVERLYPSLDYQPEIDDAVATHRWDRVHDFGVRGVGIKVGIVEDDGVDSHPDLNVAGYFDAASPNVGSHATAVAGIIGSDSTSHPGHARGVQIYSGNSQTYNDSDLIAATTWCINQGCEIVNMSFGFETNLAIALLDRYVDYQVRYTSTSIVKSCGNEGNGTGNVTSPGLGWNVLSVGNINENDNSDWADDVMNSGSSFNDPISTHNDRQKPEVAAVGTSVTSTNTSGGFSNQGSGTSYAAPGIVGMAACLMQMRSTLTLAPEAVRAIMMAGATHNLEGSSRLSDKDGAGGINGLNAYRIAASNKFSSGTFTPASFSTNGYFTRNISLRAGDRARIVLSWNSRGTHVPPFINYADVLDADLDMTVFLGSGVTSGTAVASSSSYDNNYEIVEFVPQVTGTYTIRVNDFRFDGPSEEYALAWTQHADGRYVRFREELGDITSNDLVGPCIGNQSCGLFPIDTVNGGSNVYCFASAGDSVGYFLPNGRLIYGDVDFLTQYSLDPAQTNFTGFYGTYSSGGGYTGYNLAIPDSPAIIGYPIYFTALTIDGGSPSGIKEISELKEVVIEGHATNRSLTNNSSVLVNIGFTFNFYGVSYTQCWVNSNGNVTFGAASTDGSQSSADFLSGPPRIAAFWTDLNPTQGGIIRTRQAGNRFIIEWVNVAEHNIASTANSAMVVLYDVGSKIQIKYRDCTITDCIVGVSPGGGAGGLNFDISDGWREGTTGDAIYEIFSGTVPPLVNDNLDLDVFISPLVFGYFERNTVTFSPITLLLGGGTRYRVEVDM
jgi:hypothetical protein